MNFDDLARWCAATESERKSLTHFGKTGTTENGTILDANAAIDKEHAAAILLSEAEQFLTFYESKAMLEVRKECPELNSRERELVEKEKVASVVLLVDGLRITKRAIVSRYFNSRGK